MAASGASRLTDIAHVVLGVIVAYIAVLLSPALAWLITTVFIIYELDEDWHLSDKAFQDIREFLIGLSVAATILLLSL